MATRHIAGAVLAAALAAGLGVQAQTNVYRWTDKDGKIHFSDTPPPEEAKGVTQKRMGGGYDQSQLPYATQVAMKRNPVTFFVSTQCGEPCAKGRALLANRGVPFSERDAQANPADAEALRKASGALVVPFLLAGDTKIKGFDEASWNAALDAAGYPQGRLPGQAPLVPAGPTAAQ